MRPLIICTSAILILLALPDQPVIRAQDGMSAPANQDSLARILNAAAARMTSPELIRRKMVRRGFQQRGYSDLLQAVIGQDGFGALLAWMRTRLQLDFHLPHNSLSIYVPVPQTPERDSKLPGFTTFGARQYQEVPLFEDLTFPADPWRRD